MSADVHMEKLEELLDRVKRNRLKLANERIVRPEPMATKELPIPSEPPPAIEEEIAPSPVAAAPIPEPVMPEPVMPEPVMPEPVIPEPVETEPVIPEPVMPEPVETEPVETEPVIPEPVMPEPVDEEIRTFESTPVASGPVAQMDGRPAREWTLKAVLNRAWNLGGRS
jgi:hypothetical protein